MNLKITKKMISMLCAATMAVSSIGASVSAIKTYDGGALSSNQKADLKNAVDNLNKTLQSSISTTDTFIENVNKLKCECKSMLLIEELDKMLLNLNEIKNQMKKWDDYIIEDKYLADEINVEIKNFNLDDTAKSINYPLVSFAAINDSLSEILKNMQNIDMQLKKENERIFSGKIDKPLNKNEDPDNLLTNKILKIKNSNMSNKDKIDEIIKILENNKFNDYKKQLNVILPIIDSLQINNVDGLGRMVNGVVVKLSQEEIYSNKQLRKAFRKFLKESIEKHIDQKIDSLKSNDITKDLADYIAKDKSEIVKTYASMVITSTAYSKYTEESIFLDSVDKELDKKTKSYLQHCKDKRKVKDFYNFYINQMFNNLLDKDFKFNNNVFSEEAKNLLREYVHQVTGKRTDVEKKYFLYNGQTYYTTTNHLDHALVQYPKLKDVHEKIFRAIRERINLNIVDSDGIPYGSEEDLKIEVENAQKAFNILQKCVVPIDNDELVLIEDLANDDNNNDNVINNEQNNNNNVINNEQNNNNNVINNEQNNNNNTITTT